MFRVTSVHIALVATLLGIALAAEDCSGSTTGQPSTDSTATATATATTATVPATATPTALPTQAKAPEPSQPPAANADPYPAATAAGASAVCADATWSYSKHRSGTCSTHGGVHWWTGNLGPAGPGAH